MEIEANNRNGQQIAEKEEEGEEEKPMSMNMYGKMGKVLRVGCTQTKISKKKSP